MDRKKAIEEPAVDAVENPTSAPEGAVEPMPADPSLLGWSTPIKVSPGAPSASAARASLFGDVLRMQAHEPAARRFDPEGVHRMRAAIRRLRSHLRTFRPVLDPDWADALHRDLRRPARILGAVRDLDVLNDRLTRAAGNLTRGALAPLFSTMEDQRNEAHAELDRAFRSRWYRQLTDRLDSAAHEPETTQAGGAPCREVLPTLLFSAWTRMRKAGRRLDADSADDAFHRVRILAKRARFAAEAVAPALGRKKRRIAKRLARLAATLQDTLGELQDAVLACRVIESIVARHPHDRALRRASTWLIKRQRRAAKAARARFPNDWEPIDRLSGYRKLTR